jgi:hypothetical protein
MADIKDMRSLTPGFVGRLLENMVFVELLRRE